MYLFKPGLNNNFVSKTTPTQLNTGSKQQQIKRRKRKEQKLKGKGN